MESTPRTIHRRASANSLVFSKELKSEFAALDLNPTLNPNSHPASAASSGDEAESSTSVSPSTNLRF